MKKARPWQILSGIGFLVAIAGACVLSQAPADSSLSIYTQAAPALVLPTLTSLPTAVAALMAPTDTPEPTNTLAAPATPTASQRVRLTVVGDLMLARSVNTECLKRNDFTWPYQETAFILQDADLTIGNLETPIVTGCPPKDLGMRFCVDPRAVEGLTYAGFDVVSLANNHALNYDQAGLDETVKLLHDANIDGLVDGAFAVYEINGMKIGIMTYDDTDWKLPIEDTLAQVRYNSQQVDVLIGYFHWGFENQPNASHYQQDLSKKLIDAGMKVVIGSHPHWLQPIERYNGGISFYSLGNFVSDQMTFQESTEGVIVRLTLERSQDGVQVDYDLIPVKTREVGQPKPVVCPDKYACDYVPTLDPLLP